MSIPIDLLFECRCCGVEFQQDERGYEFCSYGCMIEFKEKVRSLRNRPFDGAKWLASFLFHEFDLWFVPPLNYDVELDENARTDAMEMEFFRLCERDEMLKN